MVNILHWDGPAKYNLFRVCGPYAHEKNPSNKTSVSKNYEREKKHPIDKDDSSAFLRSPENKMVTL